VTAKEADDRLSGAGGHDVLHGHGGDDYVEGGPGHDILSGGAGNDLLQGGAGFDVYVYHTGDGSDRIEDPFGTNAVIFDQGLLSAGIQRLGGPDNTFISPDGSLTYVLAGGDLVVNGTLILNENFQNGDFGIRLITEAAPGGQRLSRIYGYPRRRQ